MDNKTLSDSGPATARAQGREYMITDVAFIAYSVRDVRRSEAFYRDVVGLKPAKTPNIEPGTCAIRTFPSCSVCFAKDPDGNAFALHQRKGQA